METDKTVLQLRLEIIQWKRKYLALSAEAMGYQHALLGVEEESLNSMLKQAAPSPGNVVADEGPLKGTTLGKFIPNDANP